MNRHPILYSFLFISLACIIFLMVFAGAYALSSGGSNAALLPLGAVAVVKIDGTIFDSTEIMEELQRYKKSRSVKAIVLRIDSPGGAVAPSQEIFEEVKKIKAHKKVVVSMGTVAASGGYYIATAGHKIFASPGTITGSIGVIMESMGLQGLMEKAQLESRVIKSGKYKDVGSPFRDMQPDEKAYLQDILDNMYEQFKVAVADGRGIPKEQVDQLAQGKIYTGEQAVKVGLVDQLGTFYDAIDEAKRMAGLDEDATVIWKREDEFPFSDFFQSKLKEDALEVFLKKYFPAFDFPMGFYYIDLKPVR